MTDEVRQALDAINQAWRDQRFDDLSTLFDEDIVMRGPGLKEYGRGRQPVVQSYVQFMAQSKVIEYRESNHAIDLWGDTAVATYDWAMTYEQKGETKSEKGQDMFVFARTGGRWLAVLRLILF